MIEQDPAIQPDRDEIAYEQYIAFTEDGFEERLDPLGDCEVDSDEWEF